MFKPNDPRFRRRLNEISQTIESANETAQTRVFVFGQEYVSPCLSSVASYFHPCTEYCFPPRDQRGRRPRTSAHFDFYDDWAEDENDALLGWSDDEYDSFLAGPGGYGATAQQPSRQRAMTYGTRRDARGKAVEVGDPTASQPPSSYLGGFFNKFAGIATSKGVRYKPSAAGLQEHPGLKHPTEETEPLTTDESDSGTADRRRRRRPRSDTTGSRETQDSRSSRGDIFPSDDEADAVPLPDEFAMVLERRTTRESAHDDSSSGYFTRSIRRPAAGSRRSTGRTTSSKSTPRSKRSSLAVMRSADAESEPEAVTVSTLNELKHEEDLVRVEEERAVEQRRQAARALAVQKGLSDNEAAAPSGSAANKDRRSGAENRETPAHDGEEEFGNDADHSEAFDDDDTYAMDDSMLLESPHKTNPTEGFEGTTEPVPDSEERGEAE